MSAGALQQVSPEAALAVERYLAEVREAMHASEPDVIDDTVEGLLEHLSGMLDEASTSDDAQAAIAELGPIETFSTGSGQVRTAPRGSGTLLGMPYDVRMPTADRIASRWWNPQDTRLFMPRAFGIGWDLNFGAVAVRLNLIEPDAEDEPFAEVNDGAFMVAVAVPLVLTGTMLMSYLWLLPELPAQLPTHWGISGQPDGWSSRAWAFGMLFMLALLPTVYALQAVARRGSPLRRAVSVAFASLFAALSVSLWTLTLVSIFTGFSAPWFPFALIMGAVLVPAAVLVVLARIGRAAEIRSDIGRK